ncbi:uncharacterized protein MONOS_4940 [Monocercomonoides exilis]|uniref:uncharacterized protein n=1 Tax=Monocercomonoides exilis TaxID=2049356 RepID=UPI00355989EF|nr:hypothetical protein MONOS_4940 [Monocercomonoides exilis]|eukprot:MONOS_4940.1-p1 / transcript=MONOS_4940.1 / gene=MONOS_4940 / organism=Monocercomonoides_exilis_PA203 / gene_product=unspecified product / transcript_product=unspecified product / location=Mono_scaffold00138:69238-69821(-) / protein_length=122 / sequence_SO=supercontig / SO=protein_coding / is_pseudo=false
MRLSVQVLVVSEVLDVCSRKQERRNCGSGSWSYEVTEAKTVKQYQDEQLQCACVRSSVGDASFCIRGELGEYGGGGEAVGVQQERGAVEEEYICAGSWSGGSGEKGADTVWVGDVDGRRGF